MPDKAIINIEETLGVMQGLEESSQEIIRSLRAKEDKYIKQLGDLLDKIAREKNEAQLKRFVIFFALAFNDLEGAEDFIKGELAEINNELMEKLENTLFENYPSDGV